MVSYHIFINICTSRWILPLCISKVNDLPIQRFQKWPICCSVLCCTYWLELNGKALAGETILPLHYLAHITSWESWPGPSSNGLIFLVEQWAFYEIQKLIPQCWKRSDGNWHCLADGKAFCWAFCKYLLERISRWWDTIERAVGERWKLKQYQLYTGLLMRLIILWRDVFCVAVASSYERSPFSGTKLSIHSLKYSTLFTVWPPSDKGHPAAGVTPGVSIAN